MAMSTETKAGIFFLVAFVILGLATFKVEEVGQILRPSYVLKARFRHASGLKVGDPVAVAGVRVGEVKLLGLDEDGIYVVAEIKTDAKVRKDATASIAWQGLLGTKYLDISLGSREQGLMESGEEIKNTREAIEIGAVMEKVDLAVQEVRGLLSGGVKDEMGTIITNMAKISEDVAKQRGTLGKLVGSDEMYKKLDAIATDLTSAAGSLKKILAENEKDLEEVPANVKRKMEFVTVDHMDSVLDHALVRE